MKLVNSATKKQNSPQVRSITFATPNSGSIPNPLNLTIPSSTQAGDILIFGWNNGGSDVRPALGTANTTVSPYMIFQKFGAASGSTYNVSMSVAIGQAASTAANSTLGIYCSGYNVSSCLVVLTNPNTIDMMSSGTGMTKAWSNWSTGLYNNYSTGSGTTSSTTSFSAGQPPNFYPKGTRVTFGTAWGQTGDQGNLGYSGSGSFSVIKDSYWWSTLGVAVTTNISASSTETFSASGTSSFATLSLDLL